MFENWRDMIDQGVSLEDDIILNAENSEEDQDHILI